MFMPPISPTGAMASGDFVDYMILYLDSAEGTIYDQLSKYVSSSTISDWSKQWTRTVNDINAQVVVLSSDINKLVSQANMARDSIDNL